MKNLLLSIVLMATCLSLAYAATPKLEVYRYEGADAFDYHLLPSYEITDFYMNKAWVRDEGAWPNGRIALLVHGFPIFSSGKCRKSMITLASDLSPIRITFEGLEIPKYDAIYFVEYPMGYHILDTSSALVDLVMARCAKLPKSVKIDVFAHSMGGLVCRGAIEFPQKTMVSRVAHLVMMGTPQNGIDTPELDIFKVVLGELPIEIACMDPTFPSFITILNSTSDEKPKVDCVYYSIVGTCSYFPEPYGKGMGRKMSTLIKSIQDANFPVHDGLISAASAGYDLSSVCRSFKKIEFGLNHDYIGNHLMVGVQIDEWIVSDQWFGILPKQIVFPMD